MSYGVITSYNVWTARFDLDVIFIRLSVMDSHLDPLSYITRYGVVEGR